MNANIALGVQPLQVPDQAAGYQRALTMAALLGQHDLQGLQIQEGQRTLRQNQMMDDAAQGSSSMEDYLARLTKINPSAAAKLQHDMLNTQETRGKISKQQSESAAQLAGSVTSAAEQDRPAVYRNMVAEWARQGLPTANPLPPEYSPEFLPHLSAIAARGLQPKEAMERGDAYAARPQLGQPTTMAQYTAPQPPTNIAAMNAAQENAAFDKANSAPTVDVPAKAPFVAPDDYRKEAARLRSFGTKAANEQAKEYMAEADRMEGRALEEQKMADAKSQHASDLVEIADASSPSGTRMVPRSEAMNKPGSKKMGATQVNVGMNATDASKAELLNQGISDMAELKGMLIDKDGKINRGIITGMRFPGMAGIPGTDSRIAYSLISNAVEAKLRAESGAAVPKEEVQRMADRFIPSPLDSDEAIMSKLRRMESFLRGSYGRIKNAGEPDTPPDKSEKSIHVKPMKKEAPLKGTEIPPMTNAKGWTLHTDAQGIRAYVSPDGKQFEELK